MIYRDKWWEHYMINYDDNLINKLKKQIMTPKEKAVQLVAKFYKYNHIGNSHAKQCALIAVDECLNTCVESMIYYWKEVKNEIENL